MVAAAIVDLAAWSEWLPWFDAKGISYEDRGPASTGSRNDPRLSHIDGFSRAVRASRRLRALDLAGGVDARAAGVLRAWWSTGEAHRGDELTRALAAHFDPGAKGSAPGALRARGEALLVDAEARYNALATRDGREPQPDRAPSVSTFRSLDPDPIPYGEAP